MQQALALNLAPWRNDRGQLIGWRNGRQGQRDRLILFQGNAGYALHRVAYINALSELDNGFDVLLMEYPGFGSRAGEASEQAIMEAADEAVRHLLAESPRSIYLAGESLGSGVASEMAARFPNDISGLLLVTPFTSLKEVAQSHFPSFLVRMILSEQYDNVRALKGYHGSLAILVAEHDEVVPAKLGQDLYDSYKGPKKLIVQKGRTHNTLDLSPAAFFWQEVANFLRER